jgi:hypothetical protein
LNQCIPVITIGWIANTDIQPPTTLYTILNYIGKYISKPEKLSMFYTEIQVQILLYVNSKVLLLSFVSKILNKLIGKHDWSVQEVSYILLQLPVQDSSWTTVNLDCRPEGTQSDLIDLELGNIVIRRSVLQRYRDRLTDTKSIYIPTALDNISFFDWIQL